MDELQVRLSAGAETAADTAATPTGPNAGKRESVREEKRAKTNSGKTQKHKKHQDTRLPPLRP